MINQIISFGRRRERPLRTSARSSILISKRFRSEQFIANHLPCYDEVTDFMPTLSTWGADNVECVQDYATVSGDPELFSCTTHDQSNIDLLNYPVCTTVSDFVCMLPTCSADNTDGLEDCAHVTWDPELQHYVDALYYSGISNSGSDTGTITGLFADNSCGVSYTEDTYNSVYFCGSNSTESINNTDGLEDCAHVTWDPELEPYVDALYYSGIPNNGSDTINDTDSSCGVSYTDNICQSVPLEYYTIATSGQSTDSLCTSHSDPVMCVDGIDTTTAGTIATFGTVPVNNANRNSLLPDILGESYDLLMMDCDSHNGPCN